jgi:hypothetical protein
LDELAEEISDLRNGGGAFVMSNSVYALDGAKKEAIKATALTPENIAKNEEDALNNPVHVFVERIAAKVTVSAAQPKFDTGKEIAGKKIYATVDGWDLYNDYDQSYLLKHIDENWTSAELGFNWNDASWFRSYWAKSLNTPFVDAENQISYDGMPYLLDESAYCGENTGNADCTMVVVKASLVDENGNAVEVATWHGHSYLGESSLLQVIANSLASRLYYFDGTKYNSIEPGHLMVKEASEPNPDSSADVKAYHVFFQLSAAGEGMTWYTYSTADGFKPADKNAVNVILGGVEPALLYKNGQTYFATEIKHYETVLGEKKYGVVRNHVYKVNINSISGFGTPVYNGNTKFDPEQPSDVTTFVSAEIRVLSWKVVEFDYDLK